MPAGGDAISRDNCLSVGMAAVVEIVLKCPHQAHEIITAHLLEREMHRRRVIPAGVFAPHFQVQGIFPSERGQVMHRFPVGRIDAEIVARVSIHQVQ